MVAASEGIGRGKVCCLEWIQWKGRVRTRDGGKTRCRDGFLSRGKFLFMQKLRVSTYSPSGKDWYVHSTPCLMSTTQIELSRMKKTSPCICRYPCTFSPKLIPTSPATGLCGPWQLTNDGDLRFARMYGVLLSWIPTRITHLILLYYMA